MTSAPLRTAMEVAASEPERRSEGSGKSSDFPMNDFLETARHIGRPNTVSSLKFARM